MMNSTMHLNCSAALTVPSISSQSLFAFYAASFFSALRFYFYYFFTSRILLKESWFSKPARL